MLDQSEITNRLIRTNRFTNVYQKSLYLTIRSLCLDSGALSITIPAKKLARQAMLSERKARSELQLLAEMGLIEITANFGDDGSRLASTYTISPLAESAFVTLFSPDVEND